MNKRDVMMEPSSFGTTLLIALIDSYGTECIQWEPETLRKQVEEDLDINLPGSTMDRIMAAMSVLASDMFFVSIEGFNNTCESLNFGAVSGNKFIPCELDDIIWGCTEARLLLGAEEYDSADWSHDIGRYTGLQLSLEGVTKAPSIIGFAEFAPEELDNKDMLLADDQLMAATYQSRQTDVVRELDREAISKMQGLLQQVSSMQLEEGQTEQVKTLLADITGTLTETQNG